MKDDELDRENRRINANLTSAERQRLVERHIEVMAYRKLEEDQALIKAVQLLSQMNKG